jgi:hypothetical protein
MKTSNLFLLSALALFTCANLHAQVTIGGTDIPKSGAILDLNSTLKGGLVLSNVFIEDFFKIPSTFHGGGGEASALKAGLTGAMIYNTNPDFCTGVHVWNGLHWGRIATETPVPAPGALSITSDQNNLFAEEVVEFAADPNAKTYKWFASKGNDAPYEYLGITTTSAFSETFPVGVGKMKVIMDDCRSVKESETSFNMNSVSPNFGSLAGSNYVYIYGDFPYAATSDYAAPSNLVAHFDGINNQGLGDKLHESNSSASWKDLKNPTFDLPRGNGAGQWLSNGFQALNNIDMSFEGSNLPATYPKGNEERTIEVIFRTPEIMFPTNTGVERDIFLYGTDNVKGRLFGVVYRGYTRQACEDQYESNNGIFYAISGMMINLITCLGSTPSLTTPNTINTVTSTYLNSINDPDTKSYINNTLSYIDERMADGGQETLDTGLDGLWIGINLSGSTFLSVRLYNRILTAQEIEHNAARDQIRYLNPPGVKIGGNSCTEVVVLSPHFLMCKVPAGSSTGAKDIEIKVNDNGTEKIINYTGAYKYVPAGDFYVSSISPIIGVAGGELTLTGNRLDEISEIMAGNIPCPFVSKNLTTYKCILPANPAGEVDITIKLIDNTVYRFARVFEYQ